MTDGQTLFVVFAALYLLESLRWLPVRARVCAGSGGTWRLRGPVPQVQGKGWALTVMPLLPPVPAHIVTLPWLLIPDTAGVLVCDQDEATPALLPWAEVDPHREGATVFLTARQRLRLPGEIEAESALAMLQRWRAMDPGQREQDFLTAAGRSLDIEACRRSALALSGDTQRLRWLSLVLFVWCFGVIAATYRWLGDSLEVLIAAGVLILLQWTQALLFWRTAGPAAVHRVKHRFWKMLAIACLPQAAMRAPDVISKAAPACAHPLATRGLIDEAAWWQLARQSWKDARYGSGHGHPLAIQALERFFAHQQVDLGQLEPVPERQAGSAAYCPRCLAQFRDAAAVCTDCGGVALKPWGAGS